MSTPDQPPPASADSRTKEKRGKPWKMVLAIALVAAGAAWYFLRPSKPDARARPVRAIPVSTLAAKEGDLHIYLTALGSVTAWNTVTIRSRADGQLLKLHFVEGQHVQAGDLLAEIDPRAYLVALEQAEGQLARDRALLDNARRELERYQNAGEAVTPQQTDTAKAAVGQYEGTVRIDQGNVDNYQLQLSYCRILAPTSGRAGIRLVDEGNLIHASDSTGIVVITQDQPIAVLFSIPEDSLPQVRKALAGGQPLAVDAFDRAMNQVLASGTVTALDNQIDAATGTVRLKAQFANDDGALFPNQFVNVRLLVEVQTKATLIPVAAAQINGPVRYVFVVKPDNTVEQRTVTLGKTEGDIVAVASGVAPGDVVVTEGLDKLQNGTAITTREQPAAGSAAPAGEARAERSGRRDRQKGDARAK